MIDSAAFPSAKMAVERAEPELQLMTVVEHLGRRRVPREMVPRLLEQPLAEVARAAGRRRRRTSRSAEAHEAFVKLVEQRAKAIGDVVVVDLSDQLIEVAGKFVTYALYPESAYSVLLSRSKSKCKISIGYNPVVARAAQAQHRGHLRASRRRRAPGRRRDLAAGRQARGRARRSCVRSPKSWRV